MSWCRCLGEDCLGENCLGEDGLESMRIGHDIRVRGAGGWKERRREAGRRGGMDI